jgi:hypothetical protein
LNQIAALELCYQRPLFSLSMLSTFTIAHAHAHPELDGWYESLPTGNVPCCDGGDAKRVDGHYRMRIDREWVDVQGKL